MAYKCGWFHMVWKMSGPVRLSTAAVRRALRPLESIVSYWTPIPVTFWKAGMRSFCIRASASGMGCFQARTRMDAPCAKAGARMPKTAPAAMQPAALMNPRRLRREAPRDGASRFVDMVKAS